jgi:putative ABC transport system ATP-binding protein
VIGEKNMVILQTKNICKTYETNQVKTEVLKNISFTVEKGDFLGIVGPSGSGKTTLLYCMSSIEPINSGEIIFNQQNISELSEKNLSNLRKHNLGFVFQFYNLIPNLTAYENVLLANVIADKTDESRIEDLLKMVNMWEFKDHYPEQLSGGMQQRIAIARALVNNPEIIFADEPTGNLDQKQGLEIMKLLQELNEKHQVTIVLVTHNEDYLRFCNKKIMLVDGEIVER